MAALRPSVVVRAAPCKALAKLLEGLTLLRFSPTIGHRDRGAAYLAGYVIESSLKSLVLVECPDAKLKTHDISALSTRALQLAALPDAKTASYVPRTTAGHSLYHPEHGWRETLRYRAPGAVTEQTAQEWVNEARQVFESTIVPMRLDGVI